MHEASEGEGKIVEKGGKSGWKNVVVNSVEREEVQRCG